MKIVSSQTEDEMKVALEEKRLALERERTKDSFDGALRELTANLLRITRGAGKGYEVGRQAVSLINAMEAYREAYGHYPPDHDFGGVLCDKEDWTAEYNPRSEALRTIARGSLQMAASRLLSQRPQESAGEDELLRGLRSYQDWQEGIREQRLAEARAARPAGRRPIPRRKPS